MREGSGKSHLLIALGTEAAMAGYRVRYTLATKLVNELVEAADDKQLTKTIARYGRVDLLCIDKLGYMELDRRGAELLFQVLTEREEKASVAIASGDSFGGWTKTFTDPRLCAAIVDRLTFGGNIIETGIDSYRLAQTRARADRHGTARADQHRNGETMQTQPADATAVAITAKTSDDRAVACTVTFSPDRQAGRGYKMELRSVELGVYHARETDLFECLRTIRRELEATGVRLCCNGARVDVWPSGMAREMGGGTQAYILRMGRAAQRSDLVSIFDPAPVEAVDDQETYARRWLDQPR
jgi:hypothetical protein